MLKKCKILHKKHLFPVPTAPNAPATGTPPETDSRHRSQQLPPNFCHTLRGMSHIYNILSGTRVKTLSHLVEKSILSETFCTH